MKIKVHNDGKEKSFSFEASIDDNVVNTCFGKTQEEAIENLKQEVAKQIKALQEIDYTKIVQVDCFGIELKNDRS